MRADMTDACTREGAERMEAEAALPKEIAEALDALLDNATARCAHTDDPDALDVLASDLRAAILADRERLTAERDEAATRALRFTLESETAWRARAIAAEAESEARRLVLVLKATELRQEWLRAERLEGERDEARATLEKEIELIQIERMLSEEERKKAYRSSQPEMAEYLLTCEHEWRKTADKLSDRCDERDRALARAERAEESLRSALLLIEQAVPHKHSPWCNDNHHEGCCEGDYLAERFIDNLRARLPAPQPAPEVKP